MSFGQKSRPDSKLSPKYKLKKIKRFVISFKSDFLPTLLGIVSHWDECVRVCANLTLSDSLFWQKKTWSDWSLHGLWFIPWETFCFLTKNAFLLSKTFWEEKGGFDKEKKHPHVWKLTVPMSWLQMCVGFSQDEKHRGYIQGHSLRLHETYDQGGFQPDWHVDVSSFHFSQLEAKTKIICTVYGNLPLPKDWTCPKG